jgi:formate hydrogenlyase subunit 3/multisubunit Na+/H+ antiporter MnhD subunit
MKRFRDAVIAVVGAFAVIFGVLTFIEHRYLVLRQLRGERMSLPPEGAWVFALVQTGAIFAVIAVLGVVVSIIYSIWDFFRSRKSRHF